MQWLPSRIQFIHMLVHFVHTTHTQTHRTIYVCTTSMYWTGTYLGAFVIVVVVVPLRTEAMISSKISNLYVLVWSLYSGLCVCTSMCKMFSFNFCSYTFIKFWFLLSFNIIVPWSNLVIGSHVYYRSYVCV
jgi:hypothetical protein